MKVADENNVVSHAHPYSYDASDEYDAPHHAYYFRVYFRADACASFCSRVSKTSYASDYRVDGGAQRSCCLFVHRCPH